jgi:hypothetical protein
MEAADPSKIFLPVYQTTWRHVRLAVAAATLSHNVKVFNCWLFFKKYVCVCQVSLTCLAGTKAGSAFNAANLPAALKLIEAWKKKLDTSSPESSEIIG